MPVEQNDAGIGPVDDSEHNLTVRWREVAADIRA
jgi:hypothetical protein